jgi:hypothetical protein
MAVMTVEDPFAPAKTRPTPERRPGGDDSVERDHQGRPRIRIECDKCDGSGRLPSLKRAGKTVQCHGCKGAGTKTVSYTRVTTHIDVLGDKSSLTAWKQRKVLQGIAIEPSLLEDVLGYDDTTPEGRDWLNRRAERAQEIGGANDRADHGTLLHDLSEVADRHEELPDLTDPLDWLDIESYVAATHPLLRIVHMEKLRVNDELRVAGTPDRVSSPLPGVELVAPDDTVFGPDDLLITDLKTGRVDINDNRLKFAMQLAIYSRSPLYIPDCVTRAPMENISTKWGIIMHTAVGSGKTDLYWVDLTLGWEAVQVATDVRRMRRVARTALSPF